MLMTLSSHNTKPSQCSSVHTASTKPGLSQHNIYDHNAKNVRFNLKLLSRNQNLVRFLVKPESHNSNSNLTHITFFVS